MVIQALFLFWKHSIQHGSKTGMDEYEKLKQFWKHSIQHGSKTN
ncbi:hypothetical protein RV11_GL002870 [Enterococcus phoeniculicola]|nr:hypothetical protein RV11_GL002870 [Enterococcus phoeniculicola]